MLDLFPCYEGAARVKACSPQCTQPLQVRIARRSVATVCAAHDSAAASCNAACLHGHTCRRPIPLFAFGTHGLSRAQHGCLVDSDRLGCFRLVSTITHLCVHSCACITQGFVVPASLPALAALHPVTGRLVCPVIERHTQPSRLHSCLYRSGGLCESIVRAHPVWCCCHDLFTGTSVSCVAGADNTRGGELHGYRTVFLFQCTQSGSNPAYWAVKKYPLAAAGMPGIGIRLSAELSATSWDPLCGQLVW